MNMASVNKIKELVSKQDFKAALAEVKKIDIEKSLNPQFMRLCGQVFAENKKYDDARKTLISAHILAPKSSQVLDEIIRLYLKMGYFTKAKQYYKIYSACAPTEGIESQTVLYNVKKALKAPDSELIEILTGICDKEYVDVWAFELALLYKKAGMNEQSIKECQKIMDSFAQSNLYVKWTKPLKMGSMNVNKAFNCYPDAEVQETTGNIYQYVQQENEQLRKDYIELFGSPEGGEGLDDAVIVEEEDDDDAISITAQITDTVKSTVTSAFGKVKDTIAHPLDEEVEVEIIEEGNDIDSEEAELLNDGDGNQDNDGNPWLLEEDTVAAREKEKEEATGEIDDIHRALERIAREQSKKEADAKRKKEQDDAEAEAAAAALAAKLVSDDDDDEEEDTNSDVSKADDSAGESEEPQNNLEPEEDTTLVLNLSGEDEEDDEDDEDEDDEGIDLTALLKQVAGSDTDEDDEDESDDEDIQLMNLGDEDDSIEILDLGLDDEDENDSGNEVGEEVINNEGVEGEPEEVQQSAEPEVMTDEIAADEAESSDYVPEVNFSEDNLEKEEFDMADENKPKLSLKLAGGGGGNAGGYNGGANRSSFGGGGGIGRGAGGAILSKEEREFMAQYDAKQAEREAAAKERARQAKERMAQEQAQKAEAERQAQRAQAEAAKRAEEEARQAAIRAEENARKRAKMEEDRLKRLAAMEADAAKRREEEAKILEERRAREAEERAKEEEQARKLAEERARADANAEQQAERERRAREEQERREQERLAEQARREEEEKLAAQKQAQEKLNQSVNSVKSKEEKEREDAIAAIRAKVQAERAAKEEKKRKAQEVLDEQERRKIKQMPNWKRKQVPADTLERLGMAIDENGELIDPKANNNQAEPEQPVKAQEATEQPKADTQVEQPAKEQEAAEQPKADTQVEQPAKAQGEEAVPQETIEITPGREDADKVEITAGREDGPEGVKVEDSGETLENTAFLGGSLSEAGLTGAKLSEVDHNEITLENVAFVGESLQTDADFEAEQKAKEEAESVAEEPEVIQLGAEAPAAEEPEVIQLGAEAPAAEEPEVIQLGAEAPAAEEPEVIQLGAEAPAAEEPEVIQLGTEAPAAEEPEVIQLGTEAPAAEEPEVIQLGTEAPAAEEPEVIQLGTEAPAAEEPEVIQLGTEAPAAEEPEVIQLGAEEPAAEEPEVIQLGTEEPAPVEAVPEQPKEEAPAQAPEPEQPKEEAPAQAPEPEQPKVSKVIEGVEFNDRDIPIVAEKYIGKYVASSAVRKQFRKPLENIIKKRGVRRNIAVLSKKGCSVSNVAIDFARTYHELGLCKTRVVATIKAKVLNKTDLNKILPKLKGGCLVIEHAGDLTTEKASEVYAMVNNPDNDIVLMLVGEVTSVATMLGKNAELSSLFKTLFLLHELSHLDLADIAIAYMKEHGYSADEEGLRAMKDRIAAMDHDGIDNVLAMVDGAIAKAEKRSQDKLSDVVFLDTLEDSGLNVLKEFDFE